MGMILAGPVSAADPGDGTPAQGAAYAGIFGGFGELGKTSMRQRGTVITPHPFPDINVDAQGAAGRVLSPVAGLQLGYRLDPWSKSPAGWGIDLAAEAEALFLSGKPRGTLDIDPQALGTQYVTLPLSSTAFLINAVVEVETPYSTIITPYVGGGAGYAIVSVNGSNSTNPSEPGINHFNSEPDATGSGLALQAKIGLRAAIAPNWSVFTEFRHVHVAPMDFTFGETDYPGEHLPTTRWNVDLGAQSYNLWVTGLDYHF